MTLIDISRLRALFLAKAVVLSSLAGVCAAPEFHRGAEIVPDEGGTASNLQALPSKAKYCSERGKGLVQIDVSEKYGEVCEPPGETVLARVIICLVRGMEAVLTPGLNGVACAAASRGASFLDARPPGADKPRSDPPERIKAEGICSNPQSDMRVLPRGFVKELVREAKDRVDPKGVRIIGAIFCDGIDLSGLDIAYTLALDRSIFRCAKSTECRRSPVEIRNFRTKGDLSLDGVVSYERILITRAEISGSFFAQLAYMPKLVISDATIIGSVRMNGTLFRDELSVENVKVAGDVDVSSSYFSHFALLKNQIDGALDLTKSQARCSYDIRKNDIDDVIGAEFGFGGVRSLSAFATKDDAIFGFKDPAANEVSAYARYANPRSEPIAKDEARFTKCGSPRSIDPGVFVFIDNHVEHSLCVRDFGWLTDDNGRSRDSNIYLNEDVVDGATWLDIVRAPEADKTVAPADRMPVLSIFNFETGTLVLDFDVVAKDIAIRVNGLHFKRVYTAKDRCESALSPRSSARQAQAMKRTGGRRFPPDLGLPSADQVTAWVKKNEFWTKKDRFTGTQPFAEFIGVFEKAGDLEAARELKIKAETAVVEARLCKNWGFHCDGLDSSDWKSEEGLLARMEARIVSIIQYVLWWLADHGYRPEGVIKYVALTVVAFWLLLQLVLGVVGYSVDEGKGKGEERPPRIKPISLMFLLGKLIPAYNIREEHAKRTTFYVLPTGAQDVTFPFRRFLKNWEVCRADVKQQDQAELYIDALRLLGLIFAIFLAAAIARLVR
ncbi:hypothetical protein V3H18_11530 [Methylocystis sp. 9N]|uniref:Pentapeptide repeat-containing protein n=1 Tax=Methylocystis borbori TaxID=3118750 RepID=A0ABU7XJ62_9HYPH